MVFEYLLKEELTGDNTQEFLLFYTNCHIEYKMRILNILKLLYYNDMKIYIKLVNLDISQLIKLEKLIESGEIHNLDIDGILDIDIDIIECSKMIQLSNAILQKNTLISTIFYENLINYV